MSSLSAAHRPDRDPRFAGPAGPRALSPSTAGSAVGSAASSAAGQILAGLDVAIPQAGPPPAYGLAMGILAVFLVLLPVAYLALIAFLGWLVAWHVFQTIASLEYGPYFVFHVPMAVLGALLLLFLVKPVFFRRRGKGGDVITLAPEDEPLLFEFVRKLCAATGSKCPARIEVDCEPNAGVRFRGGLGSLVGGDLVLRVGLPLAAGLSVRQFAGVVGHELGHFNQRSGMTGSYLIRRLNAFFAQVVFQRDQLDETLGRMRRSRNGLAQLSCYLAVAMIEPARGVLWVMLVAGELLTCGVLRRMEYDADCVEARLAGVREFERTSRLLTFLNLAARRARYDLADAFNHNRLADDLPRLIVANARQLTEHRDDVLKLLDGEKTRWFDTHPSHTDRVRNVRQLEASGGQSGEAAGLVGCDVGANHLFADFGALCRRATEAFYGSVLGAQEFAEAKAEGKARLVPAAELAKERSEQRQSAKALRRFFRDHVIGSRPIFPGPDAHVPAEDVDRAVRELAESRAEVLRLADDLTPFVARFEEASAVLPAARAQIELCAVFSHNPKALSLRGKARKLADDHEPRQAQSVHRLVAFEQPARRRLTAALRLLQREDVASRLAATPAAAKPDAAKAGAAKADEGRAGDPRRAVGPLLVLCQALQGCLPAVLRLAELSASVRVLCSAYNGQQPYPPLVRKILQTTGELVRVLRKLQDDLALVPYPFAHGTEGVSVGAALVQRLPDPQDPVDAHGCAGPVVDRYCTLAFRTLATLTEWAERVEALAGLEPLPEPWDRELKQQVEAARESADQRKQSRRYWLSYGGRATAGTALLAALVWYSVSPPSLPAMPWEPAAAAGVRWRASSFRPSTSVRDYTDYTPAPPATVVGPYGGPYGPPNPNDLTGPYGPGQRNGPYPPGYAPPGYPRPVNPPQPGVPGGARPGYSQPGYPRPGYPQPGNPQGDPQGPGGPAPYPTPGGPGQPQRPYRQEPYRPSTPPGYNPRPYAPGSSGGGYGGRGGGGGRGGR